MPKFKLNDVVTFIQTVPGKTPAYHHKIVGIDHISNTYEFKIIWAAPGKRDPVGKVWKEFIDIIDKDCQLYTGQTPAKPAVDGYIGRTYKIIQGFRNTVGEFLKDEVVIIVHKDMQDWYTFKRINDKMGSGFALKAETFPFYIVDYTIPKCICGMNKTWMHYHKKLAPKDKHDTWCDIYKEK